MILRWIVTIHEDAEADFCTYDIVPQEGHTLVMLYARSWDEAQMLRHKAIQQVMRKQREKKQAALNAIGSADKEKGACK